jgi:di/tripeptidase
MGLSSYDKLAIKNAKESGTYRAELHILQGYYEWLFSDNPYTRDFAKEQFEKILGKYTELFDEPTE